MPQAGLGASQFSFKGVDPFHQVADHIGFGVRQGRGEIDQLALDDLLRLQSEAAGIDAYERLPCHAAVGNPCDCDYGAVGEKGCECREATG